MRRSITDEFTWFLAGPLSLPDRVVPPTPGYDYCEFRSEEFGVCWRGILRVGLEAYGMRVIDPYSSDLEEYYSLYGFREGCIKALDYCDGVIAALLPRHWISIPQREVNLSVVLDYWSYPFVAFSPEVCLTRNEKLTMTEVSRFESIIPTCLRIVKAMGKANEAGVGIPESVRGRRLTRKRHLGRDTREVKCVCGTLYRERKTNNLEEMLGCPNCGRKELHE